MLCEVAILLGHKRLERGQFRLTIFPDFLGTHGITPQHISDALIREDLGQLLIEEVHLQGPCTQQFLNRGSLNLSPFVANKHWGRRCTSPRRFRAHLLEIGESQRWLCASMPPNSDLLQTARN